MSKHISGYIIDPDTKTIESIKLATHKESGTIQISTREIASMIGCAMLDFLQLDERHAIFLDDEGLREDRTEQAFTDISGIDGIEPHLAGKLVIVGWNAKTDNYLDASMTPEEIAARIRFFRGTVRNMRLIETEDRLLVRPMIDVA